jgi:hypothetical protein
VNQVEYQASFWFPVTPPQLWTIVERFDLFESWWVWLADFTADADGLVDGNVLHGTVIPPVPYRLRLTVQLQRCDRPRRVEAAIDGDLRGQASLQLEAVAGGTRAEVAWSLRMRSAPLRVAAHVAYPLMRWGTTTSLTWRSPDSASGHFRTWSRQRRDHAQLVINLLVPAWS